MLDTLDTVRYLGVIVDHHLKFDAHISSIVHKAMLILKCFASRNHELLLKAYTLHMFVLCLNTVALSGPPILVIRLKNLNQFRNFLPRDFLVCGTCHTHNDWCA